MKYSKIYICTFLGIVAAVVVGQRAATGKIFTAYQRLHINLLCL